MTALLSRLFVRDYENTGSPAVRRSYGTMVSIVCIVLNLLLSGMKIVAGMLSGALSVTADGVNNLSDAASQIVSLISFRISAKPPDRTHPFGHARIEYVASLVVSVVILIVGWELFTGSLDALISGQAAAGDADKGSIFVVAVLVGSVLTKLWMYVFNRKIGDARNRRRQSFRCSGDGRGFARNAVFPLHGLAHGRMVRTGGVGTDYDRRAAHSE